MKIKQVIRNTLNHIGYSIQKLSNGHAPYPVDLQGEKVFLAIYERCEPYTLTSIERMFALHQSVRYIIASSIPGDVVECGVWKGGSAMNIALTLESLNSARTLYLYDTYEGMTEPGEHDVTIYGARAGDLLPLQSKEDQESLWCYSPLEDVRRNLALTGYPQEKLFFIKGKVEETIPHRVPDAISLLRLDTDFYESTLHELEHLYPRLSPGGVLIIDDYGHWQGARQAVDQYFASHNIAMLLSRIDYTMRMAVKPL